MPLAPPSTSWYRAVAVRLEPASGPGRRRKAPLEGSGGGGRRPYLARANHQTAVTVSSVGAAKSRRVSLVKVTSPAVQARLVKVPTIARIRADDRLKVDPGSRPEAAYAIKPT